MAEDLSATAVEGARRLRVMVGRLRRRIKSVSGDTGVTPSQMAVLSRLMLAGEATMSDLAAAEGVRPQSMAAWLAALDEGGWLKRRPDPGDGRRQLISISDEGLRRVDDDRQVRTEWLANALQDRYDDEERQTIVRALTLLERLVAE
ncbi:MarR family winged helix-turn-helix transcriptional regulator [Amycolatopsis rubida]|uniref:DNA-binding transcriptional regulator, MarR family n=1 Tax=Amycolatopsis rubida TaxID=112413 RepID=A0A1I5VIU3_9PSEU|nr:MarR family transcriptional regulator [Amycolatopsis rubida]SFQ07237.1 DNA-binding transcriptional regulator, MarR family [Amycolatopsis rubida]